MGMVTAATVSAEWAKMSLLEALTEALMHGNHGLALRLADLITPHVPVVRPKRRGNRLAPISGEIGETSRSSAA